jgi:hypothetical protein
MLRQPHACYLPVQQSNKQYTHHLIPAAQFFELPN